MEYKDIAKEMRLREFGNARAYPVSIDGPNGPTAVYGMTKREVIAMHMMAAIVANPNLETLYNATAAHAAMLADKLIEELERGSI